MTCDHKETITVSNLRYCCKCNKYMGKTINEDIKEFVEHLNKQEQKR